MITQLRELVYKKIIKIFKNYMRKKLFPLRYGEFEVTLR